MAVWNTPITWVNGGITAANLNTVRDNLIWLKAAGDLVFSSFDDEGTATYLRITRAASNEEIVTGKVTGDSFPRVWLDSAVLAFGSGAAALDTSLSRETTRVLKLQDAQFRSYRDNFEDPAYSARVTGDSSSRWAVYGGGFMEMKEVSSTPATPATGFLRIYARDNGSGKQQVIAKFDDGAIVSMATQA